MYKLGGDTGRFARVASITAKSSVVDTKMIQEVAQVCGGPAILTFFERTNTTDVMTFFPSFQTQCQEMKMRECE